MREAYYQHKTPEIFKYTKLLNTMNTPDWSSPKELEKGDSCDSPSYDKSKRQKVLDLIKDTQTTLQAQAEQATIVNEENESSSVPSSFDHLINTGIHDPLEQAQVVSAMGINEQLHRVQLVTQPSTPVPVWDDLQDEDGFHPMAAWECIGSQPTHVSVRDILADRRIQLLMKELEPLRSQGKTPKATYEELDDIVHNYTGLHVYQLVPWKKQTWIVCCPSLAEKTLVARRKGNKRRWFPVKIIYEHLRDPNLLDLEYEDGTIAYRVDKTDKTQMKMRDAKPGGSRHQLVGSLFYRILKVLSGKCACCDQTIYRKVNGNMDVMPPSTLNAWHFAHQEDKVREPALCVTLPLAKAAEEYVKCRLECVECHDQSTDASWKRGTGIPRKRTYGMAFHRTIKDILESDVYQAFIKELDDRKVRSQAKEPAISFEELDELLLRHFQFSLNEVVDWDKAYWNKPQPNNKQGKTGNHRHQIITQLEYSLLKLLSGACASCSQSIQGTPPYKLNGWHMDHQHDKLFTPADGCHKNPVVARTEWAKCVLKCVGCHRQGVKPHWEKE